MYRLLKYNSAILGGSPKLSLGKLGENDYLVGEKTCELCRHLNRTSRVNLRFQSTITSPNPSQTVKKKGKVKRKYAELLAVDQNSTVQQKATIKRLTSKDMKLFTSTNLNLSELYKLKDMAKTLQISGEHTYNSLGIIHNFAANSSSNEEVHSLINNDVTYYNVPALYPVDVESNLSLNNVEESVNREFMDGQTEIFDDLALHRIPSKAGTFLPETEEDHHEPMEVVEEIKDPRELTKKTKVDQKYREKIVNKTLAAYLELWCHLKQPQRGLQALIFHKNRRKKNKDGNVPPITSIKVYNALLKGFASKGNFEKMQEILEMVAEDNISLDLQSYIAIMECLGRRNIDNILTKQIRIFSKEASSKGFTFSKMMNDGCFLCDERAMVLKAMHSVDPDFQIYLDTPKLHYRNMLVNHLNEDSQLEKKIEQFEEKGGLFTPDSLKSKIQEQLDLEIEGYVTIKSIESKGAPSEDVKRYRELLQEHYKTWEESAHVAFVRDLGALTAQKSSLNHEVYLRCIPIKDYVTVIVDEAKKLAQGSETYSPTVNMLYRDLGHKVYARYKVLKKQKTGVLDKIVKIHSKYCTEYACEHPEMSVLPEEDVLLNPRQRWQWAEQGVRDTGATLDMDHQEWVPTILQTIGKFLYHIIMHDLKVDVNAIRLNSKTKNMLPGFYTIFRTQGRIVKEEVKPHPVLSKLYRASMPETLTFPAYEVPMKCPPIPWISVGTGGYLVSPVDVVRMISNANSQRERLANAPAEQLYPSLDALNQLAAVPWKVNRKILDIILSVFNNGGSAKLDVPEPSTSLAPPPPYTADMDKQEKFHIFRQKLQHRRKKAEMYSLWCDCLYRLSLANHFRDDVFWLPHNMDFRGRVYPVPPHLNHLGSDLARSMLIFAESRPLGPEGLDWLKVHLINLTGLKKRDPVTERLKYANEIMHLILDSADKPLTGEQWWVRSDEPWQTLACCLELAEAVRSPNPEEFRSCFPIHQDGSCNGLQHYAALGRDAAGAYSVNLAPSHVPQDVYSAVVALVEEQRQKDAESGIEIAQKLEGFVKRKVIKQTVMTTVYGVTRFGARLQIAKQLKDIDDFPKDSVWAASSYLTGRTFDSLRTMFTSTREIQDWFTECARLISGVSGQHVEWVTPLGLPIVQPYIRSRKIQMPIYESYQMDTFEKPNVMKQKNAFPPNFIHSLDSSHMMLTSLHCERKGITFVSVHDCYWTHPSTVHIMNKVCREQFVALHSEPILEELSIFLTEKYSFDDWELTGDGSATDVSKKKLNKVLRQLPKTGKFDINQVIKSVYFFS
ncbi:unnamed protein product [Brassicogethes aeneus]|uniref:DNA-directed RNA polymerase n=1 Tax=Brassicogethes aeneus TaxID=1431903 RepID=A0A9P0BMP4_BRAAE|nr:unnamed protein product [Brassicogethes aeneus]